MARETVRIALLIVVGLWASPAVHALEEEQQQCTPDALFDEARAGLQHGSPALKRYLAQLMREAALEMPTELWIRAIERETDPAMLEVLGSALAAKAEQLEEPSLVAALLKRTIAGDDPALRAAAVRSLRGAASVELMAAQKAGVDVDYQRLIKDESPQVRAAVVENLINEDDAVYSGHDRAMSEAALDAAFASDDAAVAAQVIAGVSTEAIGADAAQKLARALDDDSPALRAAAARALGGLSPAVRGETSDVLVARYRRDDQLEVRTAILESLARLERQRAIPTLMSLRPVDVRLEREIDAWVRVLSLGLPEWALIVREKNRA
jgi:HEAT repeat protein